MDTVKELGHNNVQVGDIVGEWFKTLDGYTPAGEEILSILRGLAIALNMSDSNRLEQANNLLERLSSSASDEYTLGATAMLMTILQLENVSPQQSLLVLEEQVRALKAPAKNVGSLDY